MILTQLLLALAWLWVPLLLIFLFARRKNTDKLSQQGYQRDQLWQNYLTSFREVVKTDKEKHLLDTLIQGKSAYEYANGPPPEPAASSAPNQALEAVPAVVPPAESVALRASAQPLDNTILLLYFGAFLLIVFGRALRGNWRPRRADADHYRRYHGRGTLFWRPLAL